MNICGVIAEYNPFHNGHQYHLAETRQRTGCDYLIVAMSGDYVQRGTPSLLSKYVRAEAALRCGADLVVELPLYSATASAEEFADGGIRLMNTLGCIQAVSYGAELSDTVTEAAIRDTAAFLSDEPESYRTLLQAGLRSGLSFAKARSEALLSCFPTASEVLATSNNILAVEYEKSILARHSSFSTLPIVRTDKGYKDTEISELCSATAIRTELAREHAFPFRAVPESLASLYDSALASALTANDFSDFLYASLMTASPLTLTEIYDISDDLANRILSASGNSFTYTSLAEAVKCKAFTRSHIDRALCHCMLSVTENDMLQYRATDSLPYIRILGVREDSLSLLTELSKTASAPILTNVTRDTDKLSGASAALYAKELRASRLYSQVMYRKSGVLRDESRQKFPVIS